MSTRRTGIKRALLTIATYLASLAIVAVATFFLVIFLAGPHGGVLPASFEGVVLVLGWLAVLVLPVLSARFVWRRVGNSRKPPTVER